MTTVAQIAQVERKRHAVDRGSGPQQVLRSMCPWERWAGSGGAPLLDLRYNYDLAGNVALVKEPPAAASGWPASDFSFRDNFTTKDTTNWWWSAYQVVPDAPNNWVKSVGMGSNYDAHFYRTAYSLSSGQGLQVRLRVSQTDANAHVSIEADDATYRRFGVIAGSGKLYVQYNDGSGYRYPADLLTGLQANTWYVVRIVVDDVRGFCAEAYQESNPTVRGSYNTWMPAGKRSATPCFPQKGKTDS